MRAIDGDELLGIEQLLDTDVIRKSKTASWLLEQVLHDIQAMPTLTPPNEPLTLEQLKEMVRKAGKPVVVWTVGLDDDGDLAPGTGEWEMFDGNDFSGPNTMDDLSNYGPRPHGYFVAYRRPPEGGKD